MYDQSIKVMKMSENIDLNKIQQNIVRSTMQDGLIWMLVGIVIFYMGLMIQTPALTVFVVFFIFYSKKIVEEFKEKYTYPRIGKITFKEKDQEISPIGILLVIGVILVGTITYVFIVSENFFDYDLLYRILPISFGLIMFGPSIYNMGITGQKKQLIFGVYSVLLGIIFYNINIGSKDTFTLYLLALGLSIGLVGVIIFYRFISTNPIIEDEFEEMNINE